MDSFAAFAMGEANRDKPLMVFDWNKAAKRIKETKPESASAGLRGDWEHTGGNIYMDDKPIANEDTYVYLASTWAVPELSLDGVVEECYLMEDETPGWDARTYWPDSALAIINAN